MVYISLRKFWRQNVYLLVVINYKKNHFKKKEKGFSKQYNVKICIKRLCIIGKLYNMLYNIYMYFTLFLYSDKNSKNSIYIPFFFI